MSTPTPAPPSTPPAGPPADPASQEQERGREGHQRRPGEQDRPPWEREGGEPFDPERAWKRLQALQSERDRARTERDEARGKVEEHDRSQMSETQRLEADRDNHRQRADAAEAQLVAYRAAVQHGVAAADLEDFIDLLGTGTTEQLTARAERLASRFSAGGPQRPTPPPTARPQENGRPRGGGDPTTEPDEQDLDKLAARMTRR